MAIHVHSCAAYLASVTTEWRDEDYVTNRLIKAIKGEPFNGYARVTIGGAYCDLYSTDPAPAFRWFAEAANRKLEPLLKPGWINVVPLPNSSATASVPFDFATAKLVRSMVNGKLTYRIHDLFRWKQPVDSAHRRGGSRVASVLEPLLLLRERPREGPYLLVDDVITSGGHVQAAVRAIKREGGTVLYVLTAGRTVYEQLTDPFQLDEMRLAE